MNLLVLEIKGEVCLCAGDIVTIGFGRCLSDVSNQVLLGNFRYGRICHVWVAPCFFTWKKAGPLGDPLFIQPIISSTRSRTSSFSLASSHVFAKMTTSSDWNSVSATKIPSCS
ncbi:hypothetical protein BBR47_32780 [Brevibacillus brevis NBRC 100599]|uniref:Uncharacterized protein n=1 Tax=Brevibacillus brevis (strain 47 / JCM 6285 / NBRC 100599) TaxID=358681 RepID=C0ZEP6_BREBN|nr:hypothetical protein BBR47_32780 [Brevibacillus brevis NBRC 100599]